MSYKGNWTSPFLRGFIKIISSVQFRHSHVRLFATPWTAARQAPCPSPTPGVHSNSCPSSRWCHTAISSSVIPFSSCPQSLPASGSFLMSQLIKYSLGISNFLEEISSLSHSVVFLYFFALLIEEGFLISPWRSKKKKSILKAHFF